jgi:hypothetical protein
MTEMEEGLFPGMANRGHRRELRWIGPAPITFRMAPPPNGEPFASPQNYSELLLYEQKSREKIFVRHDINLTGVDG